MGHHGVVRKLGPVVALLLAGCAAATRPPALRPEALPVVADSRYPAMFFRDFGVNPTVETTAEPVSAFAADLDTASYSLARGMLTRGHLPVEAAVRVEEFLAALAVPPEPGPAWTLSAEALPSPNRRGYHVLHLAVAPPATAAGERLPAWAPVLVEGEPSGHLRHADTIAIVDGRQPGGRAGFAEFLRAAYGRLHGRPGRGAAVVLRSDGVADGGPAEAAEAVEVVRAGAARGIRLLVVGEGLGRYDDELLERLARAGDGRYGYVDRPVEMARLEDRPLRALLTLSARDVRVEVRFDPSAVLRYRLVGYEGRGRGGRGTVRPPAWEAGDLGEGDAVTAIYEVCLAPGERPLGRVRVRTADGGVVLDEPLLRTRVRPAWADASGPARLAHVTAAFAEKLRGSYWVRNLGWVELAELHARLPGALRTRPEVEELGRLIETAAGLDRRGDRFDAIVPVARMGFDHVPVVR